MFRVLYVDDEPAVLEVGKRFLELDGQFHVDTITSAPAALDLIGSTPYDAIISDYQMAGMDGIEFLKKVRGSGNTIPFILFTGRGREEVVIQALNEGADFYLQKGGDAKPQFIELSHKIRQAVLRKRAEGSIRDHERLEAEILNFLPDATFAIDTGGIVIAWNRAMEQMTGVAAPEILGKGDYEYAIPFYNERRPILIDLVLKNDPVTAAHYPSLKRHGNALVAEITIPLLNGRKDVSLWFTASTLYDDKNTVIGAIESIRDITSRRLAEEALRESEARYRAVVEDQTEFISRFLPDGTHIFVNDAYCRYFSRQRGEIIGKKFIPAIPDEDRSRVRDHFASLTRERPTAIIDHRIILPDGSVRWQRWSDRAFFSSEGTPVEYQSVGRDISEIKQAEAALRESEEEYRALADNMPDYVLIHRNGKILWINRACENAIGIPANTETSVLSFVSPESLPLVTKMLHQGAAGGQSCVFEAAILVKGGEKRFGIVNSITITYGGEPASLVVISDITDRKRAEDALRMANRQLTMLTGITRHDISNQIHVILAYLEMVKRKSRDHAMIELVQVLEPSALEIKSQVEFTKLYQDIGSCEPQWLEPGRLLHGLHPPPAITLKSDLSGLEVYADPMLGKVFFNLLDNSVRHGERVTEIRTFCMRTGRELTLVWEDNGVGIPAGLKEKIFERGFGKNTGHGLFLAREILSLTGLTIRETGEPGRGARFEIAVPEGQYRARDTG